jgi:hypothetical protein
MPWFWLRTQDPQFHGYAAFNNVAYCVATSPELRQYLAALGKGAMPFN